MYPTWHQRTACKTVSLFWLKPFWHFSFCQKSLLPFFLLPFSAEQPFSSRLFCLSAGLPKRINFWISETFGIFSYLLYYLSGMFERSVFFWLSSCYNCFVKFGRPYLDGGINRQSQLDISPLQNATFTHFVRQSFHYQHSTLFVDSLTRQILSCSPAIPAYSPQSFCSSASLNLFFLSS